MHSLFSGCLNRERLDQQMNVIRHHTRGKAFDFLSVPEMTGHQRFCAGFRRKNEFVLRLPGNVIGRTGNFKVRKIAFAGRGF
ncbi:MAG: hypothetical protein ABSA45_13540 [Verrucomicrobiota bacterium]